MDTKNIKPDIDTDDGMDVGVCSGVTCPRYDPPNACGCTGVAQEVGAPCVPWYRLAIGAAIKLATKHTGQQYRVVMYLGDGRVIGSGIEVGHGARVQDGSIVCSLAAVPFTGTVHLHPVEEP